MFENDASLSFRLTLESPYSFKCQRCGACCNNKRLSLSPAERARLAEFFRITDEVFTREYLDPESGEVKVGKNGDCGFLGPFGCRVHPARPQVCRLFPLGILRDEEGREFFGIMPLHPDCVGLLGTDGTVEEDLKAQGVSAE
ncbi:MAG: YkgJ family cysteine cluster protein [Candidatus Aminicenantes bacterium]|nr:YkgJ family cysteine cluster protein [Candidatus Aminicenantes bacterium]